MMDRFAVNIGLQLLTLFQLGCSAEWTSAIATIVLVIVAWVQLRAIRETSRADFIHRLNGDFFNPTTRGMLQVLLDQQPRFDANGGFPRFIEGRRVLFNAYELDDLLLGPLEAVGIFEQLGAVEIKAVYDVFGYYINLVWEHAEIQHYISWQRSQPDGWDIYERLETLYQKLKIFRRRKEQTSAIWKSEVA